MSKYNFKSCIAKIYELNSCMIGNVNENAYLDDMKENFDLISKME